MPPTTVLEPIDRQAIVDLLVAYSWSIDAGEADRLADLFLPDGRFEGSDGTVSGGRADLIKFAHRVFRSRPYRLQHVASNFVFDVTGPGEVRVQSYVHIFAGDPAGTRLLGMGTYDDVVVKASNGWKFRSRKFLSWGAPGRG